MDKLVFYSQGETTVGSLRDGDRNKEKSLQQETPRPHEVMVALSQSTE